MAMVTDGWQLDDLLCRAGWPSIGRGGARRDAKEPPLGWATGMLPLPASEHAILWFKPVSLDQAIRIHLIALELDPNTPHADRQRALLSRCVLVSPEHFTLDVTADPPETEPPEPGALEPLFTSGDDALVLGDPTMIGSVAYNLLEAVAQVSGWPQQMPNVRPVRDDTFAAFRAHLSGDGGRWFKGLLPDPEDEVYIRPYDEAERDLAQERAAGVGKDWYGLRRVDYLATATLCAHCLRDGPRGEMLIDPAWARQLPFGFAQAVAAIADALVPVGGAAEVRFRG